MLVFIDLKIILEMLKVVSSISQSLNPVPQAKHGDKLEYYQPESVFKELNPELPQEPIVKIGENKIFIELLNLAAIKLRLTLRLGKINIDPTSSLAIVGVAYPILASVSNISDAPLYFTEIIMKNTYAPLSSLIKSLQKNYTRQAIFRFYYLLGSMDIIGNPIGLLDRLGSGVFEFLNEPRKGILKGPKEFAEGLNKGFKSLVTNVVGGGLNSVSRVTGSLYTLFK
jgi:vacuolar protein sorting-associated protein 13A/C